MRDSIPARNLKLKSYYIYYDGTIALEISHCTNSGSIGGTLGKVTDNDANIDDDDCRRARDFLYLIYVFYGNSILNKNPHTQNNVRMGLSVNCDR